MQKIQHMQNLNLSVINIEELKNVLSDVVTTVIDSKLQSLIQPTQDEYFTRVQTAEKLGIALSTLHDYTLAGLIPAYRIGSRVRYKRSEIEQSLTQIQLLKRKRGC
jgi:excisionase family DNA binding protein